MPQVTRGKLDEAIKVFREATHRFPKIYIGHYDLGRALQLNNQLEAAIASYQKVFEINPKFAPAYNSLGEALLYGQKDLAGAITAFKKAIELDPKNAKAFNHLGDALVAQKDLEGAISARNKAIELDPKNAEAYFGLGIALHNKKDKDLAGAITAFKKAIGFDSKNAKVYNNLGIALRGTERSGRGDHRHQKSHCFDPKYVKAYVQLGLALQDQKDSAGAITAYKKAIELESDFPAAYWYLGLILLPKVLSGESQPADTAERIALAMLCQHQSRQFYVACAGFYSDGFAADPKLTNHYPYRYNAACAAALAGCGQGKDAANLGAGEYARLRKQSLAWLGAELDAWRLKLDKNPQKDCTAVGKQMQHWQQDPDFRGVRSPEALAKLHEAERRLWQQFWQNVEELSKRARDRCLMSAGALDPSFGNGGLVSGPNVGQPPNTGAFAVVVQTDGKIVAGGGGGNQPGRQVLERFNANGTLDRTFGSGGVVQTAVGAGNSNILALALQSDGKIVAVGYALHSGSAQVEPVGELAVVRYNSHGRAIRN